MLRWIHRIRYRLLVVNAMIVAVPLVGLGVARFYEREMLLGLEEDMIHQAQLLRQVLLHDDDGLALESRYEMLRRAARETRTRIRLLDATGQLVADSHRQGPPEGPERAPYDWIPSISRSAYPRRAASPVTVDVADRPEVKAALAGKYGSATRVWKGGDLVYLFSALPIVRQGQGGGKVEGVIYVTRTTVPVRVSLRRLRATFLKVLAASLAATAVISLYLAGTISRPLSKLTKIAERIAEGDRSRRLNLERKDEIGQLARAFDVMTHKLDDRARYIAELAANISHEFKSPLTSIRGATELLLEGAADDPEARKRFLENILADAHRLDRLVTRLLELSRVEADLAPEEPVEYESLVRDVIAARSNPAITLRWEAAGARIFGKPAHLASAIGNLVDNAVQHAKPGTPITVRVRDLGARIETSVHNEGNPISEANLPRIWDRFFTTRAAEGGTGLGLPIVRTVVAAHGGSVAVKSSAGEGTTFLFDLPRPA